MCYADDPIYAETMAKWNKQLREQKHYEKRAHETHIKRDIYQEKCYECEKNKHKYVDGKWTKKPKIVYVDWRKSLIENELQKIKTPVGDYEPLYKKKEYHGEHVKNDYFHHECESCLNAKDKKDRERFAEKTRAVKDCINKQLTIAYKVAKQHSYNRKLRAKQMKYSKYNGRWIKQWWVMVVAVLFVYNFAIPRLDNYYDLRYVTEYRLVPVETKPELEEKISILKTDYRFDIDSYSITDIHSYSTKAGFWTSNMIVFIWLVVVYVIANGRIHTKHCNCRNHFALERRLDQVYGSKKLETI